MLANGAVNSSVAPVKGFPPAITAPIDVPAPAPAGLPVPNSAISDQLVPFQKSHSLVGAAPPPTPAKKPRVEVPPVPPFSFAAAGKLLTSVQLVPSQDSVFTVSGPGAVSPPANIFAVYVPMLVAPALAAFKSPTSVQVDPSYISVCAL